jgi:hypothetical protein
MEGQRQAIDPALARAEELGAAWATTADPGVRDTFADAIEEFSGPLLAHLDQEEADILPLAQKYVTEEEWGLLAKHVLATTPKQDLVMGLGGILEGATPDERDMMLGVIPAVPKVLYQAFGNWAYIKDATAVRGVAPVGL